MMILTTNAPQRNGKREVPGANVNSGNDPVSVHTSELEMDDEISFRKNVNFLSVMLI